VVMKISTKQKIINKAVELFNKKGFASVTLFEIAGLLNMTRGNLTYYFKDKDALLESIVEELWAKMEVERDKTVQFPSFENLHNEIQLYYRIQRAYSFIFLDYHVLNHSAIQQKFRELTEQQIKDNEARIAFAITTGNMHPEPYEGLYHNLAFNTWMLSFYWLSQQMIRGEKANESGEDGEMNIWSMLLPHFTEKGLKAFRNFFGDDYLKNLGKSFKSDIGEYVKF